jgi:hypothetical protein
MGSHGLARLRFERRLRRRSLCLGEGSEGAVEAPSD